MYFFLNIQKKKKKQNIMLYQDPNHPPDLKGFGLSLKYSNPINSGLGLGPIKNTV